MHRLTESLLYRGGYVARFYFRYSSGMFICRKANAQEHSASAFSSESSKSVMSLDEVLYLSKNSGIFTVEEIQKQIIRSPSFSKGSSPFLLENFFNSPVFSETDAVEERGMESRADAHLVEESLPGEDVKQKDLDIKVDQKVAYELAKSFNPSWILTFWHNGREWLQSSIGVGTRKRAVARVVIMRGTGQVRINGEEDVYWRWPHYYNRMDVVQPFYLTQTAGIYDAFICVSGGGVSGQSGAARLAIGRALVKACPSAKLDLEEDLVLYEDKRQKLPKMPGRRKCRSAKSWSKR